MSDFLFNIDVAIFKFFNQTISNSWFDEFMPFLTDLDRMKYFKVCMAVFFITLFIWKFKRKGVTYFLFLALALSLSDFVGGQVKKVFERPRPFQQIEYTQANKLASGKKDRSFYSNHSSNTFTMATYASAFFPPAAPYAFTLATLVAVSRVYVGVHYPSDVLVGSLLGIFWGTLISRLVKKILIMKDKALSE